MRNLVIGVVLSAVPVALTGQTAPTGADVLDRAIQYHDPAGRWPGFVNTLIFDERRPDGPARSSHVLLDNTRGRFALDRVDGPNRIEVRVEEDQCVASLNGSSQISDADAEALRLTCDQIKRTRNYYLYLWGLPMKLRDPGTIVGREALRTRFADRDVWSVRVTYDPSVGSDTWYFYFDPDTYRMVGYRFYHDESKNDGEYITLDGEYRIGDLRIPMTREWYTNDGDRHLGTDRLVGHHRGPELPPRTP